MSAYFVWTIKFLFVFPKQIDKAGNYLLLFLSSHNNIDVSLICLHCKIFICLPKPKWAILIDVNLLCLDPQIFICFPKTNWQFGFPKQIEEAGNYLLLFLSSHNNIDVSLICLHCKIFICLPKPKWTILIDVSLLCLDHQIFICFPKTNWQSWQLSFVVSVQPQQYWCELDLFTL